MSQGLLFKSTSLTKGLRSIAPRVQSNWCLIPRSVTSTVTEINHHDSVELASAKPFEQVPGFRKFPFIGTSWIYFPIIGKYSIKKLHIADRDKYRIFGDVMREKFGRLDMVTCFNPVDVEKFFRREGKYPSRGEFTTLKAYRESRKDWFKTTGIMVLQGKEWHDLRSKVQPHLMKPKAIHSYLGSIEDISQEFVQKIRYLRDSSNEVPNLMSEFYKWALEAVACVGLDTKLGCLAINMSPDSESMTIINAVQTTFDCMNKLEAFNGSMQFWKYWSTPTWRKFVKSMDVFSKIAMKHVQNSLEEIRTNKDPEKELTLLQSMLCTPGMDPSGAVTTVLDMLMAGVDTTSHTMAFLLYHLAKNPEKQEKLYQEIVSVLPNRSDKLTSAATNNLRYLKACIKESMRIDPIVRGTARTLEEDVVLSGYRIPAGTICFSLMQVSCRLEKYFENADKFIPERWLNKEKKHHPFLFLPFGFGPRSCIGRRLAELEMICLVTEIIKNFKLEYHYEDIDMVTRLVSIPDKPLRFNFIDRS